MKVRLTADEVEAAHKAADHRADIDKLCKIIESLPHAILVKLYTGTAFALNDFNVEATTEMLYRVRVINEALLEGNIEVPE